MERRPEARMMNVFPAVMSCFYVIDFSQVFSAVIHCTIARDITGSQVSNPISLGDVAVTIIANL